MIFSEKISIKKNVISNAIRTVLNFAFPLITFPYISRILGPEGIGQFNFANSTISYFLILASLGIPSYGVREVARWRDDKIKLHTVVIELFSINIISSIITYIILFFAILFIPKFSENSSLIAILSITILFTTLGMDWLFQGLEQYVYITIRSIIFQLISIIMLFILVKNRNDVIPYAVLSVFASVGANVVNFLSIKKYFKGIGHLKLFIKQHLKPIFTFWGMTLATSLYINFNTVLLGFFSTTKAIGYYSTGLKIITLNRSLIGSFSGVLLPRSSYYIKNNENDKFSELIGTAFQLLLCLALPSIIGLIGLRKEIILIFAGNKFLPASNVIALLSFNILIVGISNIVGMQILIPLGKEKITLYSVLFGSLIDICLSVILMPRLAETGAAISLLFTELGITLFQIIACKDVLKNFKNYLPNIKPYIIGSIGIILILFICNGLISNIVYRTIISVLLSIIEYFAVLYISKDKIILSILGKMNFYHKKS